MLAGRSREYHHAVTVNPISALATHLQRAAIHRAAYGFDVPAVLLVDSDPAGAAWYIERHLIDRGQMDGLREAAGI
jgi:hypothetical protein